MRTMENGLYINNLRTFLAYEEKIVVNQGGLQPGRVISLEFRNVCFRYDGTDEDVLSNVSFAIGGDEKIALVGINGAGKTTLVKLLMRLYDPTSGQILLNGTDIREYDIIAYRGLIGTVFQDYRILSMSVLENVIMDNITDETRRNAAIEALKNSGAYEKAASLPNGEDTVLTREFDDSGAVLSGGEYQKIAVARAFARNSPILILDEPSSALDPIAEYEMYETIIRLCTGRMGIFISHRLSSAVMADRVLLLDGGAIAENGSHQQLMRQAGKYAEMYTKQAESYLMGEVL